MTGEQLDLAIIGAGPGGYVAAIRAVQLGLKSIVIEEDTPGGVCLNWGCIPSKNLIHQADDYLSLLASERLGVSIDRSGFDYSRVHANSRTAAKALAGGVAGLLRKNKIRTVKGRGRLAGPGVVSIDEGDSVRARNIILATGSRPMSVPGFEFDEHLVLSSTGILNMTTLPRSLVILGGGAIGCEFAYVMHAFGVTVTLVEMAEQLLPTEDRECAAVLEESFRQRGITVHTGSRARALSKARDSVTVSLTTPDGTQSIEADRALVVFGRSPNTADLGLDSVGISVDERGFIPTGDYQQTSAAGVFAIGDICSSPLLAHVASREGELAVEYIAGHSNVEPRVDSTGIPSAIYCEPQVAGFGLREQDAIRDGIAVRKSVFPFRGIGKAVAVGRAEGLIKLLCDAQTGELLGGHVVGANATEIIHEMLLARSAELLPDDITRMIHAHPSLAEGVAEAARGLFGTPIHI